MFTWFKKIFSAFKAKFSKTPEVIVDDHIPMTDEQFDALMTRMKADAMKNATHITVMCRPKNDTTGMTKH